MDSESTEVKRQQDIVLVDERYGLTALNSEFHRLIRSVIIHDRKMSLLLIGSVFFPIR